MSCRPAGTTASRFTLVTVATQAFSSCRHLSLSRARASTAGFCSGASQQRFRPYLTSPEAPVCRIPWVQWRAATVSTHMASRHRKVVASHGCFFWIHAHRVTGPSPPRGRRCHLPMRYTRLFASVFARFRTPSLGWTPRLCLAWPDLKDPARHTKLERTEHPQLRFGPDPASRAPRDDRPS